MIPASISSHPENDLQPGDWAGAFFNHNSQLMLAGMAMWNGDEDEIITFGDHYLTPEKDGFLEGDTLIWMIYRQSDEREYIATPIYNADMPDSDGTFIPAGLSGLDALKILAPGINEETIFEDVLIYPVPAVNEINIEGLPENTRVHIYGTDGRKIIEDNVQNSMRTIDLSKLRTGNYLVLFIHPEGTSGKMFSVR
jgi:hypothetical protein